MWQISPSTRGDSLLDKCKKSTFNNASHCEVLADPYTAISDETNWRMGISLIVTPVAPCVLPTSYAYRARLSRIRRAGPPIDETFDHAFLEA